MPPVRPLFVSTTETNVLFFSFFWSTIPYVIDFCVFSVASINCGGVKPPWRGSNPMKEKKKKKTQKDINKPKWDLCNNEWERTLTWLSAAKSPARPSVLSSFTTPSHILSHLCVVVVKLFWFTADRIIYQGLTTRPVPLTTNYPPLHTHARILLPEESHEDPRQGDGKLNGTSIWIINSKLLGSK